MSDVRFVGWFGAIDAPSTPAPTDSNSSLDIALDPEQATGSGSSYIGVAGNIDLGGASAIGARSFAVISKIGLAKCINWCRLQLYRAFNKNKFKSHNKVFEIGAISLSRKMICDSY